MKNSQANNRPSSGVIVMSRTVSLPDSAFRHLVKYLDGYTDEDHLIAAIWNLCGLAWTEQKHPELMDIPARIYQQEEP